jgi:hypothetical protein
MLSVLIICVKCNFSTLPSLLLTKQCQATLIIPELEQTVAQKDQVKMTRISQLLGVGGRIQSQVCVTQMLSPFTVL